MSVKTITLTRKQIAQLAEISQHFKEIEQFDLISDHGNGIGPAIRVKFNLFNKDDTSVDITDVSNW